MFYNGVKHSIAMLPQKCNTKCRIYKIVIIFQYKTVEIKILTKNFVHISNQTYSNGETSKYRYACTYFAGSVLRVKSQATMVTSLLGDHGAVFSVSRFLRGQEHVSQKCHTFISFVHVFGIGPWLDVNALEQVDWYLILVRRLETIEVYITEKYDSRSW